MNERFSLRIYHEAMKLWISENRAWEWVLQSLLVQNKLLLSDFVTCVERNCSTFLFAHRIFFYKYELFSRTLNQDVVEFLIADVFIFERHIFEQCMLTFCSYAKVFHNVTFSFFQLENGTSGTHRCEMNLRIFPDFFEVIFLAAKKSERKSGPL